ncbi:MAG: SEC-C metal-binding domain-containing protein, partial [Methanosarcina vacuolata]|nr:SEC-C metal-binding domain-containing protein [Methanosarcina vacuolata]
MSKKIGRNDPCPCGSGKKYKHCCLGRSKVVTGNQTPIKQTPIIQASPKSEKSDISMLAIMRFEQKL